MEAQSNSLPAIQHQNRIIKSKSTSPLSSKQKSKCSANQMISELLTTSSCAWPVADVFKKSIHVKNPICVINGYTHNWQLLIATLGHLTISSESSWTRQYQTDVLRLPYITWRNLLTDATHKISSSKQTQYRLNHFTSSRRRRGGSQ